MKRYSDLEYLRLSKGQKFLYKLESFFAAIPRKLLNLILAIGRFFKNIGLGIAKEAKDIITTFTQGDWKTKLSYLVMGFGSIARGQILRGILFLLFEIITRRKPSDKFMEVAETIGLIIVLGLVILANGNDIIRLFR